MRSRLPDLIDPYSEPKIVHCAYEMSLGREVFITDEQTKTKRVLMPGEQVRIPPGQFANLLTEEKVTIPSDALGFISMKFKLKQRGLVNVSGFHVDPGYSGNLLFSVFNAGPTPLIISQGTPAFLLWLCDLDAKTDDLYIKGPRTGITDDDVSHLQGEIATPQALATRVEELESRIQRLNQLWDWSWKVAAGAVVTGLVAFGISQIPF
jgi:dCTP deaminase